MSWNRRETKTPIRTIINFKVPKAQVFDRQVLEAVRKKRSVVVRIIRRMLGN